MIIGNLVKIAWLGYHVFYQKKSSSISIFSASHFVATPRRNIEPAWYRVRKPSGARKIKCPFGNGLSEIEDGLPVDVRILNAAPLSFKYQVIKAGIPLAVSNDDERADFVESTLAQYFDFAYHRASYLKETIGLGV